jgi:hypothetical protein
MCGPLRQIGTYHLLAFDGRVHRRNIAASQ